MLSRTVFLLFLLTLCLFTQKAAAAVVSEKTISTAVSASLKTAEQERIKKDALVQAVGSREDILFRFASMEGSPFINVPTDPGDPSFFTVDQKTKVCSIFKGGHVIVVDGVIIPSCDKTLTPMAYVYMRAVGCGASHIAALAATKMGLLSQEQSCEHYQILHSKGWLEYVDREYAKLVADHRISG